MTTPAPHDTSSLTVFGSIKLDLTFALPRVP
jgi:hypothetical protein